MAWYNDYADAWNARDGSRVVSFMTEDAVYEDIALDERHQGHEDIASFVESVAQNLSTDYSFEFSDPIVVTDDGYALEWVMRGTHDRTDGQLPATGKPFEIHGVSIGRLEGGKIKLNRDYWSMGEFLVSIGLLPPPRSDA